MMIPYVHTPSGLSLQGVMRRLAVTPSRASGRTKEIYAYPKAFRQYNKRYGDGGLALRKIRAPA